MIKTDNQSPAQYFQSLEPIRDCDIVNYLDILKTVSEKRLNIKEIACLLDRSYSNTNLKIRVLEQRGFVRKVFDGQKRIVLLGDKGRELLRWYK